MERYDFNVLANSRGYQVQYRGRNIGGAGISNEAPLPRGKAASKQIKDYLKEGEIDIDAILNGKGEPRFYDAIGKIDLILEAENKR